MTKSAGTQHQLELFGSTVQYWSYGPADAPVILMVHGFRGNHVGLSQIISELDGFQLVVPDLPGYGLSTPMTELPHSVEGYSAFVEAFMAAVGLKRPVLLGHSFGSIVAAHFAAHRGDLISDLILVNPIAVRPGRGLVARPASLFVRAYYWLGANLPAPAADIVLGSRAYNRLQSLTLATTKDPQVRRHVYRHHLSDLEFAQNRRVIAESFADSITKTALDDAAHIKNRTLLIAGERDNIVPVRHQHTLKATIPAAELEVIPGVGHLVHLETPQPVAEAVKRFLQHAS